MGQASAPVEKPDPVSLRPAGMSEGVDREVESSGGGRGLGWASSAWHPHSGHRVMGPRTANPWASLLQRLALSLLTPEELIDSPRRTRADIRHARDQDPLKKGAGGGGHGRAGGGGEREGQQAVRGEVEDCLAWALQ